MKMNRRLLLTGVGTLGAGSLIGGAATNALFSDEESGTVTTTAGAIDIELNWHAIHNGEPIALQETPTDTNGQVAAHFDDVKPGDTGCFMLGINNDTNPAWIWFALDIEGESDGGEPPTGDPQAPESQYPWVCGGGGGDGVTDGDVTVTSDGETLFIDITAASGEMLEETSVHIGDEVPDIPQNDGGQIPGQFDYKHEDVDSETDSYQISFEEAGIECGDELVISVHAAQSDGETCWAGSTSGPWQSWGLYFVHTVDCNGESSESEDESGYVGEGNMLADNIHTDLFWDDNENCEIDSEDRVIYQDISLRDLVHNINRESGGVMPEWYSEGQQHVSLAWEIPFEVGNEIQRDELSISFTVYGEQRRHNQEPTNPWL